jgi:hypothetical protein
MFVDVEGLSSHDYDNGHKTMKTQIMITFSRDPEMTARKEVLQMRT